MVGAFIVMLLSRLQMFWGWFVVVIFTSAIQLYQQGKQGRRVRAGENEYITLSLSRDPADSRKLYRQQIEGKRDGLIEWCRFKPSEIPWNGVFHLGGKFLLVLLVIAFPTMLLRPIRPGTTYDWKALVEFLFGLVIMVVSWRFVRKMNERAARAFQEELDATDETSKSQSV
jgi:hypothetical protein